MAPIGVKALEKLADKAGDAGWLTPLDVAKAKATLNALRVDYNERHAAPEQPDPPQPAPSIFSKPGWFAVRYEKLPQPDELVQAGVKWIVAVLSHGANGDRSHANDADDQSNQAWLSSGKALPYRARGIKVGGWGWHQGFHVDVEAAIASIHIANSTLDLWIANAEEAWKGNDQARIFAEQLETRIPAGLPVAWSTLGAASGQNIFPFDYSQFTSRGWHILPQAYPQDSGDYELDLVLDHAERARIPKHFVHPTISNHQPVPNRPGTFRPALDWWHVELADMRQRGYLGHSFWAHDFTVDDVRRLNV